MSNDLYKNLGLTPEEVQVYSIIVSKFVRTNEEIGLLATDITPEKIQKALTELEKRKFLRVIPGKVPQYIALAPTLSVTSEIDKQLENELSKIQEEIKSYWEKGQTELVNMVNDFQKGPELFSNSEKQFHSHFNTHIEQLSTKSAEIRESIQDKISNQNQVNSKQLDDLFKEFTSNLKTKIQRNIQALESSLQSIKNAQTEERNQYIDKISRIYLERIDSLNGLFSGMKQSIEALQQQVANAKENLGSVITTINEQTTRNIEQNKNTTQNELNSIGEEATKKITDKLIILNQKIETVQMSLITSGEESLKSIQEMVQAFNEAASNSSFSIASITNKTTENLWGRLQEMLQSFAQTINRLDDTKGKLNSEETISSISNVVNNAKDGLAKGLEELENIRTSGIVNINTEMNSHLSSYEEKMHLETSQLFEKLETSIREHYSVLINRSLELTTEIFSFLEERGAILNQENTGIINATIKNYNDQVQPLLENLTANFSEMINTLNESEKIFIEDSELNLVDTSTSIDELNLKLKEIQTEKSQKLSESLQFLRNVANEEFSSFGSSASMMLGQMQSTLNENVSTRIEEITQNFKTINNASNNLEEISSKTKDQISAILSEIEKSITASNQTLTEVFEQDILDLDLNVEEVTKNAKMKQEDQLSKLNERLDILSENIEKSTQELSRNIPNQLDEYRARHADEFNSFERTVKAELNKIKARLTEINKEVTERLTKRVSLGKGGFQDIEKIVNTAMDEFRTTQKRTEKLIDDQINNFQISSESFAETINASLNTQKTAIQNLMETIRENVTISVDSSYEMALNNISEFSDKIKEKYDSRKRYLSENLGGFLSNISSSLSENLKQNLTTEFGKMFATLENLNQTANAPQELETILSAEVESFIQNLQIAFQSTSESGATRIIEVIDDAVVKEINTTLETLKDETDLSKLKEIVTNHWKESSLKGSSVLNQINENLGEQSKAFIESLRENAQNLSTRLEEAINHLKEVTITNNELLNTNIKGKIQEIPTQLEEKNTEIVSILQTARQEFQDSSETIRNSIQDSVNKLSSQIQTSTNEKLQEIRSIPTRIDETSTELIETVKEQYNNTEEIIDTVRTDSLEHLKKIEQQASNEKTQFKDQIQNIETGLENELATLKSLITEIDTKFPEKEDQMKKEIQQAMTTFGVSFQDIITKLDIEINSGKDQLNQKMDHLYQDFQVTLENFLSNAENFVNSLNTRYETILDQANNFSDDSTTTTVKALESEKKNIIDRQQELFTEVDNNLTTFSTNFGQVINGSLEKISEDMHENVSGIKTTINEVGGSWYNPIDTMLTETHSFVVSEGEKTSKVLEHEVSNLISEVDKKVIQIHDTISSDLAQIISNIPNKIGTGLAKSKELMSAISEVQNLASEVPIASIEETYVQTQPTNEVIQTLEAMMTRTKSTIQIMVPKLSMIPFNLLKQAGTRRRIQILTQVDSQNTAKKITGELDNVQLKHYEEVDVYAFARDGNEEAVIGSGDDKGVQLIITTDSRLIGILKEIIQDLWPRGKAV